MNVKKLSKEKLGLILTLISATGFGAMPIFAKLAYQNNATTTTILVFRFNVAAIILWVYLYITKQLIPVSKNTILHLIVVGVVGYGIESIAYLTCVKLASASLAGILLYLHPILVYLTLILLKKDNFSWNKITALLFSFLGLILVLGSAFINTNIWGVLAGLMAAFAYTFYVVGGDKCMKIVPPLQGTAIVITCSALTYLIVAVFQNQRLIPYTLHAYLWLLLITLFSTVIAVGFFWLGVSMIGPTKATIICTTEPLITVFLAYIFLGEKLSIIQSFGCIFIILSIIILKFNDIKKTFHSVLLDKYTTK